MAVKAQVLSLRSVWCHGNHMNAHTSDATIIITFDLQAHEIQVHKYCTKWETFRFALPAWKLPRKIKVEPDLWQLSAGQVFSKIRVLAKSRNRWKFLQVLLQSMVFLIYFQFQLPSGHLLRLWLSNQHKLFR